MDFSTDINWEMNTTIFATCLVFFFLKTNVLSIICFQLLVQIWNLKILQLRCFMFHFIVIICKSIGLQ